MCGDKMEINHENQEKVQNINTDPKLSDVVLVVQGEKFFSHREVLASKSDYFRSLLCGGLKESSEKEITLEDDPNTFKILLNYMYTGAKPLTTLHLEEALDLLIMANKYCLSDLEALIVKNIEVMLSLENVPTVLNLANTLFLKDLLQITHNFVDERQKEILEHSAFAEFSQVSLSGMLKREKFQDKQIDVFRAVERWCSVHHVRDSSFVQELVKFNLIDPRDVIHVVRPTGLVGEAELLAYITQNLEAKQKATS